MASDPGLEAIHSVLAEIPKGQLSERQAKIAAGLSLIRDRGYSMYRAAKEVGVSQSVMWRHARGLVANIDDGGVAANERAVVAGSFDIAQMAEERIVDRLADPAADWNNGDLTKVWGIAVDKIALRRRWRDGSETRADEHGISAISKMLQGATIVLAKPDPAADAIDVTALSSADLIPDGDGQDMGG